MAKLVGRRGKKTEFLRYPNRPDEKINYALEKRRLVALDSMVGEEKYPAADGKQEADSPVYPENVQRDTP
ncbi:MAG: hypothetical protein ABR953_12055 [Candidatus Acidiferrales bacterium]